MVQPKSLTLAALLTGLALPALATLPDPAAPIARDAVASLADPAASAPIRLASGGGDDRDEEDDDDDDEDEEDDDDDCDDDEAGTAGCGPAALRRKGPTPAQNPLIGAPRAVVN